MRIQLLIFVVSLYLNNTLALKGLTQKSSLRLLQNGPPVADSPKDGTATKAPKEGSPKVVEPKKDVKGDAVSKDKKSKKCKKAKATPPPPPINGTEERQLQDEFMGEPMMDDAFCLQGDATEAECQAAMKGQLPKGHQRVKANVRVDISYKTDSSPNDLLNQVGQILKTETAADFIGCDDKNRLLAEDEIGGENSTSTEEVRVTGVDFQNLKTDGQGSCNSTITDSACEIIYSNVEIHYTGEPVSTSDQEEMFDLLVVTIQAQAANGDFSEIGTIENVEVSSEISGSTGSGSNIAQTAGIPAGVIGAFLVIVGGVVIGYCMMRGRDDDADEHNESNDVTTAQRGDVVEAEAIAVIDDEEKESKWKFNPSKFL